MFHSSSKKEIASMMSSHRVLPLDTNRSLSSLFHVNSIQKSSQNTPSKYFSIQYENVNPKKLLSNHKSEVYEDLHADELTERQKDRSKIKNQKLKETNAQLLKVIDSLQRNLDDVECRNKILVREASDSQKQFTELEDSYQALLYEKEQDCIYVNKCSSQEAELHQSIIRSQVMEEQLNDKIRNNIALKEQNLLLLAADQVKSDRIELLRVCLVEHEHHNEVMSVRMQQNEISIDKFYRLARDKKQVTASSDTQTQTYDDDALETLCFEMNEKLWERKQSLQMQDLNQKKAQLLLREKGVQQKEDKIFQFHKKLKETHQIEM